MVALPSGRMKPSLLSEGKAPPGGHRAGHPDAQHRAEATKPLVLGYYSARTSIPAARTVDHRARLSAFADREGYALADIFAEPSEEPSVALQALCHSAEWRQVAAVVVAELSDLGTTRQIQQATRGRLASAGIHVLVLVGGAA
jgi:hypothetical protein